MRAILLLASIAFCLPALSGGEAVPENEAEWPGSSYPELPDRPWFALPFHVNWAFEDARGRIWLGSETSCWPKEPDEVLVRRAKEHLESAFDRERPLLAGARILHQDATGRIWISVRGSFHHTLGYDGKKWVEFPLKTESAKWNAAVSHLYEDAQGRIWLNGLDAVCRFEDGRFELMPCPPEVDKNGTGTFFSHAGFVASPDGLVMLATWTAGAKTWCYREGRLFPIDAPPGKPDAALGWNARWPVNGDAVLHTGYMPHRNRVHIPGEVLGRSATADMPEAIRELLTTMDDEDFRARETATRKLRDWAWGEQRGREAIRDLLRQERSVEVTARLQDILRMWEDPKMSPRIASGPWLASGLLRAAAPRAEGVVLCWMTRRTSADGAGDVKGTFWLPSAGPPLKVPISEDAGSNMRVHFDGRGAPLIAEWRYGSFRFHEGHFVRATPAESDGVIRSLLAVDSKGRAFFKGESDAVFVAGPQDLPATPWVSWPQVESLQRAQDAQVWADFETAPVSRHLDGEWSPIQTAEGELNGGVVIQEGRDGKLLCKGRIRADPERFWLLDADPNADRKHPSDGRLIDLVARNREAFVRHFARIRYGELDPGLNQASVAVDTAGHVWVVEPFENDAQEIAVVTEDGTHSLKAPLVKAVPSFKAADGLIRLPGCEGVILLHDRWKSEGSDAVPLVLRWQDGRLDVRPLYRWIERYGAFISWCGFLTTDGRLYLGERNGNPGVLCVLGERVEFLPHERLPVLEHPRGTLWFQDLTRSGHPTVLGVKALVVRRGKDTWRLPLRATTPRTMPVVDRQGLVWIGLGNGVTGISVSADGVRVVHEVPWDIPGRTVYDLFVDGGNRLWGYDRSSKEALRLELNRLQVR